MSERFAAEIDAAGDVVRVIVIPPDTADADAYCAGLGLPGVWADCPSLPAIGMRRHEGDYYRHWIQIAGADTGPEGAESGFPVGAEVFRNGEVWVSTTANNVWEPGVSGWRRKGEPDAPPPWVQPTGAHDAYKRGERVSYNGQDWENTGHAANVWAPGVFGWVVV